MRGILDIFAKWRNILHKSKEQYNFMFVHNESTTDFNFDIDGVIRVDYSYNGLRKTETEELHGRNLHHSVPCDPNTPVYITGDITYLQVFGVSKFDAKSDALQILDIQDGDITSVDLRDCPNMTELYLESNSLERLNISTLHSLEELACDIQNIKEIWYVALDDYITDNVSDIIMLSRTTGTIHLKDGAPYNDRIMPAIAARSWTAKYDI